MRFRPATRTGAIARRAAGLYARLLQRCRDCDLKKLDGAHPSQGGLKARCAPSTRQPDIIATRDRRGVAVLSVIYARGVICTIK
jgi:hypothetical protein